MKPLKVREDSGIDLSIKNLVSIIIAVAVSVWAYFGIIERLNIIETNGKLMLSDVEKNTEFRIKWPRGEMGSLPADSEQFLLIEDLISDVEDIQTEIKSMRNNQTNITRLQKDMDRVMDQIELTKDKGDSDLEAQIEILKKEVDTLKSVIDIKELEIDKEKKAKELFFKEIGSLRKVIREKNKLIDDLYKYP